MRPSMVDQAQMQIADRQVESGGRGTEEASEHLPQIGKMGHNVSGGIQNAGRLQSLLHGGSAAPQGPRHFIVRGLQRQASDQRQSPVFDQADWHVRATE